MDFGGLKQFKEWADHMFDHTLIIAKDDPHLETFKQLNMIRGGFNDNGIVDLRIVDSVGCEGFAKIAFDAMSSMLVDMKKDNTGRYPVGAGVKLKSVEVFEHAGNSAIYERGDI